MVKNPFKIGGIAKGESFIGRKEIVARLKDELFNSPYGVGKSIVGLPRIGKTSLANQVFSDYSKNVVVLKTNLASQTSYLAWWQTMMRSLKDKLGELDLNAVKLREDLDYVIDLKCLKNWPLFLRSIVYIFKSLEDFNLKVIMWIDEFDYAKDLFKSNIAYWELLRTLFSEYEVSSLIISRHHIKYIEESTQRGSTLHGVLETEFLSGFDSCDLEEYYAVYECRNLELSSESKERINYYCGNSPFLLSILGHYLLKIDSIDEAAIEDCFWTNCNAANDYLSSIWDYLSKDGDLKRLIPFVLGPNYGVDWNDKQELLNLGYLRYEDENGLLVSISKYFEEFMDHQPKKIQIWDCLSNLEKNLKLLIEKEKDTLADAYGINYESDYAFYESLIKAIRISSSTQTLETFVSTNKDRYNVISTFLDVMSLRDVFCIIEDAWDSTFSKWFHSSDFSLWKSKFDLCWLARNPIAHCHEEYLTQQQTVEVEAYCQEILDLLDKPPCHEGEFNNTTACQDEIGKSLIGKEVEFSFESKNFLSNGGFNLRGYVCEDVPALIPKNYAIQYNDDEIEGLKGRPLKVIVEVFNHGKCQVRPI